MKKKFKALFIASLTLNLLLISLSMFVLQQKGGIDYLLSKVSNTKSNNYSPYYLSKTEQFKNLKSPQNQIVFLGDSLIDNAEWGEMFSAFPISNRGIGGDGTFGVLNRINEVIETKPKKVFIMIGTNDLQTQISTDQILNNYKEIIFEIQEKSPSTHIYIHSLLPINKKLFLSNIKGLEVDKMNKDILLINKHLKSLSKDTGSSYINLYDEFVLNKELNNKYTYDGLHLNGEGYEVWKEILEKYVE